MSQIEKNMPLSTEGSIPPHPTGGLSIPNVASADKHTRICLQPGQSLEIVIESGSNKVSVLSPRNRFQVDADEEGCLTLDPVPFDVMPAQIV